MITVVRRIIQRVVGYNFNPPETVIENVCLMSDGTLETLYARHRHTEHGTMMIDCSTLRPYVERRLEEVTL